MQKLNIKNKNDKGFSLVELIIGIAVFVVIVVGVYNAYTSVFNVVYVSRAKINAIDIINEQLEIIRNMPYASVGIAGGIPSGVLLHSKTVNSGNSVFNVLTTVRNVDDPFDGTFGGTPNDTSPADFKTVEIEVSCALCKNFVPMIVTTRVAPKNLENTSNNGALFIKVFDANGNPLKDAAVHIANNKISPAISFDDVTNTSGMLQIVDVPPGTNAYEITVSKNNFSTDKTYPITPQNPHPTKPHATVIANQVTQISLVIDRLSTLVVSSQSVTCSFVPDVDFSLIGGKNIGLNPTIPKYSENKITGGNGFLTISNIEWDAYTLINTDTVYDLIGSNILSPIALSPNSTLNTSLIIAAKDPNTLLVVARDSSTNLPLSGVSVKLAKTGFDSTKITGQGFMVQTDWSGGSGQATSTDKTKYLSSDGNMEISNLAGDVTLKKVFGEYLPSGVLTSSSFDTGAESNFQQLDWTPVDQLPSSNVRLQVATNNDGGEWNFTGPDGTANTYYTTANKNIFSGNNGNRYIRYKLFLDSTSTTTTPNISDISFTYTLSCTPPGQVYFSGLSSGMYDLMLSKSGYTSQTVPVSISQNWQTIDVVIQPN